MLIGGTDIARVFEVDGMFGGWHGSRQVANHSSYSVRTLIVSELYDFHLNDHASLPS
jgi:hypothetical protein